MTPIDTLTARANCLVPRRLSVLGRQPGFRRAAGVVLFADIAGFTAMTEAARRRQGARGIEQLTKRLNGVFAELLAAVHQAGGDVLKFGGDALLVAFDGDGESRDQTLSRAAWCVDRLHRTIRHQRHQVGSRLALHLGLATGEWTEIVVGVEGQRREHFVGGDCIDRAMEAAASADPGTCRLMSSSREWPQDIPVHLTRSGRGVWQLIHPRRAWECGFATASDATVLSRAMLDFVPVQLRSQLEQAGFDPLSFGEHRRVNTLFAFWHPPAAGSGDMGESSLWHHVFAAVHEATETTGGLWARSDPGGKYQKVLILFGAPTSADDDMDRALECASILRDRFSLLGARGRRLRFGIGLTTATVFAGYVGGPDRHEFTAMGDGVNLAARLAARAPQGVIQTDQPTQQASSQWRFARGPQLKLKGVRGLVPVFHLLNRAPTLPCEDEDAVVEHPVAMESTRRLWEESPDGPVRIEVYPPADGRRFVTQFIGSLELPADAVSHFRFLPDDGAHPHGGLRRFLLWCARAETEARLREEIESSSRERTWDHFSLLYGPEQRLARALGHTGVDAWVERTIALVADAGLLAVAGGRCSVVVLEQAHYLSDIDRRVFERLVSLPVSRPRFIMVRQHTGSAPAGAQNGAVTLGPISKRELQSFIERLLPTGTPSVQLLRWLHERSGGIARVARLYFEHLRNSGLIVKRRGQRGLWHLANVLAVDLPDVLRTHNLQRIDGLPHHAGVAARALAVLGDGAPLDALESLCRPLLEPGAFATGLATLKTRGIVEETSEPGRDSVSFTDPACRRAVYDTISFAVRESWHRLAAQYWRGRGTLGSVTAAEHLFCARDPVCLPVLEKAAHRARSLWLLDRSRHLYRWALLAASGKCDPEYAKVVPPLPRELDEPSRRLLKPFAEVLQLQGLYQEARRVHQCLALDGARRLHKPDQGESLLAVARIEWLSGRYQQARRQTSRVFRLVGGRSTTRLAAQAHFLLGETARRTGGMRRAHRALEHAVRLFEQLKDGRSLADALNALGLVQWSCGRLDAAQQCFVKALRSSTRSSQRGDPSDRGQIANNLGILMEERGRLHVAQRYYRKAFDVFDRLGHRRNRAYSLGNLANLYRHGACYERARAAYDEVELELLSIGEQHAAVYTVGNRGDLLRDFGELAGAAELYHRTLQYACQVGDADLIAESYCRLADIQLGKQRYGEAARLLRKASSSAQKAHSREFAICARLLKAEINLKSKGSSVAGAVFEEAGREAADAGLHYYLLWARHGQNRCLLHGDRPKEALRSSRRGQIQACRAGYRWWELRFAALGAQIEIRCGNMNRLSPARGETMLEKAIALKSAIEATIGDPAIRAKFGQLPLILSIAALDHEHAVLTSR